MTQTYSFQFSRRKQELEREPERNHEDHKEGEDQGRGSGLHDPEDGETGTLANGV